MIKKKIASFKSSEVYSLLQKAREKYFEFNFEVGGKEGRIDLLLRVDEGWLIIDFKTGQEGDYATESLIPSLFRSFLTK